MKNIPDSGVIFTFEEEPGEDLTLGPEVVQQTTEKVKLIQERMKTAQSRQTSYQDNRRKDLELGVSDHVFVRVTSWTGIGRALKSQKLTPHFIGPFQIIKRVGLLAYQIALPPSLSNLRNVFHVSQLHKYIHDPSHVIQWDDVQVKENLTYETLPLRIEDRRTKHLRGKEILLVMVIWGELIAKVIRGNFDWDFDILLEEIIPKALPPLSLSFSMSSIMKSFSRCLLNQAHILLRWRRAIMDIHGQVFDSSSRGFIIAIHLFQWESQSMATISSKSKFDKLEHSGRKVLDRFFPPSSAGAADESWIGYSGSVTGVAGWVSLGIGAGDESEGVSTSSPSAVAAVGSLATGFWAAKAPPPPEGENWAPGQATYRTDVDADGADGIGAGAEEGGASDFFPLALRGPLKVTERWFVLGVIEVRIKLLVPVSMLKFFSKFIELSVMENDIPSRQNLPRYHSSVYLSQASWDVNLDLSNMALLNYSANQSGVYALSTSKLGLAREDWMLSTRIQAKNSVQSFHSSTMVLFQPLSVHYPCPVKIFRLRITKLHYSILSNFIDSKWFRPL
ncbi:hypothetical protein D0Y65_053222 [Glycine soja]|uniref:Tf2-1-like SH3-like domain-containing protein n=1 Tax=Glycine soja TaxID=3848 RepID=A0A445F140_GLYSO|nr:hypothetical protein D0Y65_053222 [Glycine soja]